MMFYRKLQFTQKTIETDQLLSGTSSTSVNKMTSHYYKKPQRYSARRKRCTECHNKHIPENCTYKSYSCNNWKKKGYLKSVCKSKFTDNTNHAIVDEEEVGSVFTCLPNSPGRTTVEITESTANVYQRVGKQIWINLDYRN